MRNFSRKKFSFGLVLLNDGEFWRERKERKGPKIYRNGSHDLN